MEREVASYASGLAGQWRTRFGDTTTATLEGSLVKVDLSGFTRMSERLARASRDGAEEVNAVLNDVFAGLIADVHAWGGDVLQFCGDALLQWFEGDDHALRAACATWDQRRGIASRPSERTPAGPVRLRMSAGIASGRFLVSNVGASHRELVLSGPAAARTVLLEHRAPSGAVHVDDPTVAALRGWRTRPTAAGDHVLIGRPPASSVPVSVARPRLPTGRRDGVDFVPPELREVIESRMPAGEHRQAAVAFVEVSGLAAAGASGGARAVHARLERVAEAIERVRERFGVCWTATDLVEDGAVYLLFAGAPVARERDDERMVLACRALLDDLSGEPVRIGVNSGPVFAADIGVPERRTYAILGDTVNLAARLMSRARPETMLVARAVLDRAGHRHHETWLPPFTVKGKRAPVEAAEVGAAQAVPAPMTGSGPRLVGRDAEVVSLRGLVGSVAAGGSGSIVIAGGAGSGKSRLVTELLDAARARDCATVTAAASVYERSIPFAAIRPALARLLGIDGSEPRDRAGVLRAALGSDAELLPLLSLPLGVPIDATAASARIDPEFVAQRREELLVRALGARTQRPVIVVVEDLHWADEATIALVGALLRAEIPGFGMVATARPVGDGTHPAGPRPQMQLDALPRQDARELVVAAADRALSDADIDAIVDEAAGNPLFLGALARYAALDGTRLPASAAEVIAARIDTLAIDDRAVLRDASVFGPATSIELVATVLGEDELRDAERWSRLADYVTLGPGGTIEFRNDLVRRSAYDGLAVRRRRWLHGAIADRLVANGDASPALLAVHLHEAGRWAEAHDVASTAARAARAGGALRDAARLFEIALTDGTRAGRDGDALRPDREALGDVYDVLGEYRRAEVAYSSALAAGRPLAIAVKRGAALERLGEHHRAARVLGRAVAEAQREGCTDDLLAALLRQCSLDLRRGRLRVCLRRSLAAAELARSAGLHGGEARALLRAEMAASELGDERRWELGSAAARLFEAEGPGRDHAHLLLNLGATAKEAGRWHEAQQRYAASARMYLDVGDVIGAAFARNNEAEIRCDQGRLDEAREILLDVRRVFEAAGHTYMAACARSGLGRIAARLGELDRARTELDEASAAFERLGARAFHADAQMRVAEVALLAGEPETALAILDGIGEITDDLGEALELEVSRFRAIGLAATDAVDGIAALLALAHLAAAAHPDHFAICVDAGATLAAGRDGSIDVALLAERDAIALRLGIVRFPPLRLGVEVCAP